jgi:hypothetical protein
MRIKDFAEKGGGGDLDEKMALGCYIGFDNRWMSKIGCLSGGKK